MSEEKFVAKKSKPRETYSQILSLPKSVRGKINKICLHKSKKISHLFCEFINNELEKIEGKNVEEKLKGEMVEDNTSMLFAFHEIMRELKNNYKVIDDLKAEIENNKLLWSAFKSVYVDKDESSKEHFKDTVKKIVNS